MKNYFKFSLFIFLGILMFSCKNSEQNADQNNTTDTEETVEDIPNIDFKAMATELCDCMKPLVDLQNKVNSLEPEEIKAMVDEIEKISNASEKCVEELEAKYGKVEGDAAEEKAEEAFKEACPYVAGMIAN